MMGLMLTYIREGPFQGAGETGAWMQRHQNRLSGRQYADAITQPAGDLVGAFGHPADRLCDDRRLGSGIDILHLEGPHPDAATGCGRHCAGPPDCNGIAKDTSEKAEPAVIAAPTPRMTGRMVKFL